MSVIGSFSASGKEYVGEIATLTIQAKAVRIIPAKKTTDAGPSHRVDSGRAEIGAAWSKDGKAYLSVLLDDPSMMAPFYASLVSDEQEGGHNLIWSRGSAAQPRLNRSSGALARAPLSSASFADPRHRPWIDQKGTI